ncbi:MAG TPA: hypothetical protein VKR55_02100 [Bradyrhizobium sp.]|uniref:hypothetical protein n=1 Tax=Bradyrhizobium sp. TaxID=376 RepID=UPI002CFADA8E|nr:hypothetical protein [Bradyrhizobium sp.]HLZ00926.1 hypothetical protein [Bradyrhizobium sp.]
MAAGKTRSILGLSAALLLTALATPAPAQSQSNQPPTKGPAKGLPGGAVQGPRVNTIKDVFERLGHCWKPPSTAVANPMDITVIVSFNRSGAIMGHPRITYESPKATDNDRLAYRVAVMEALQRCSPMPFTDSMAAAVAGHPFAVRFRTHLEPQEKRAWLSPKIL